MTQTVQQAGIKPTETRNLLERLGFMASVTGI
jgi:hypothetical protein